MHPVTHPSTRPTTHPSHQFIHVNKPGLREFNPRQRLTLIQLTMHSITHLSIHPPTLPITITPIHPFIHATSKQHTTTEKPGLREITPRQRPTYQKDTHPTNHASNHPYIHPTNHPSHQYTH